MSKRTWGGRPLNLTGAAIDDASGAIVLPGVAVSAKPPEVSLGVTGGPPYGSGPHQYGYSHGHGHSSHHQPLIACDHDGDVLIHTFPSTIRLYGADSGGAKLSQPDLIVDCAGFQKDYPPFVKSAPKELPGLNALNSLLWQPRIITLDWPDATAPFHVPLAFWRQLRAAFSPNSRVVVCCAGGHGRTGTALAALLITDGWSANDAITHIRSVHCKKAVETKTQEAYLERLDAQAAAGE